MKFTRTLFLVFAVALILPLILNVKNSNAKGRGFGGRMFIIGYKIAKHYQKNYYSHCKKVAHLFDTKSFRTANSNHGKYYIEKCLQGIETYKEIHRNK